MPYCHVSAQIAQFADDVDEDVICDVCSSENVEVTDCGNIWFKHCQDCGWEDDNQVDYGD